jgi:hypothetical protein
MFHNTSLSLIGTGLGGINAVLLPADRKTALNIKSSCITTAFSFLPGQDSVIFLVEFRPDL